jgi:hypothetical protein
MVFGTLSYARRLKQAGVPDVQAEAMAATRELLASEFATKADIAGLKSDIALLKNDVAAVRIEMSALEQRVMAAVDTTALRLTVCMGGLIAVGGAVLAAIIKR